MLGIAIFRLAGMFWIQINTEQKVTNLFKGFDWFKVYLMYHYHLPKTLI